MTKRKYAKPTIPYEAYLNLKKKHNLINKDYKEISGRKHGIPFTKFMLAVSQKPIYFGFNEIKNIKKGKKKEGLVL